MKRLAVVLFNLGGPDEPQAVQPFLFNLFNDKAIISAPGPIRWCLAQWISRRRAPVAREIYRHLGGKSPLLELTRDQGAALREALLGSDLDADEVEVFVCMRYWHPMSGEVVRAVQDYRPDEVVLVPLYPQFSTTTTGSFLADWRGAAARAGLDVPTRAVCCYFTDTGWIGAQADLLTKALATQDKGMAVRVLFSAHGLPKKIVDGGDPYQWQVEQTAAAVMARLGTGTEASGLPDWVVCYQSRVGPLEWIGPSTEHELARAAADKVAVVIIPIAFVSEHSETLVELDVEYRDEAARLGVPKYTRVGAVGTEPAFISGLAAQVKGALARAADLSCGICDGARVCPSQFGRCPLRAGGDVAEAGNAANV